MTLYYIVGNVKNLNLNSFEQKSELLYVQDYTVHMGIHGGSGGLVVRKADLGLEGFRFSYH